MNAPSPLCVLAVLPGPAAQADLEFAWLVHALGAVVRIERLVDATENGLRRRLSLGGVHAVHLIGRGRSSAAANYASLDLNASDGNPRAINARYLGGLLAQFVGLELVLLQPREVGENFHGLEPVLREQGVPAVLTTLAMTPPVMGAFAARFYGALAAGYSLDQSWRSTCQPGDPLQSVGARLSAARPERALGALAVTEAHVPPPPVPVIATSPPVTRVEHAPGSPDPPPHVAPASTSPSRIRILLLAANPMSTNRIAVGEEQREIGARIRGSAHRDQIELVHEPEVRAGDLAQALQRHRPTVVHFSGHGSEDGELQLVDASGQVTSARSEEVVRLFGILARELGIRCVVLNACYSAALAARLSAHVDCVIGTPAPLQDASAIAFSGAFYEALGFGRSVDAAYRIACVQVNLTVSADDDLPTLHCRSGVRADDVRLFADAASAATTPIAAAAVVSQRGPPSPAARQPAASRAASNVVFRWMHLSDIHFGAGRANHRFDQKAVAAAIVRDVERNAPRQPDAIFVTGDVAFSAKPDQYAAAGAWLTRLAHAADSGVDRLRLVPGNHDVDRAVASAPGTRNLHRAIRGAPSELDDLLELEAEREPLLKKLSAWREFVRSVTPSHPPAGPNGLDWSERIDAIPGVRGAVHVAGLSSVWVSDGCDGRRREDQPDPFDPNMVLGLSQLQHAFGDASHESLLFVLTHHPAEWMRQECARSFASALAPMSHIHLCGHVHQAGAGVTQRYGINGRAVRFIAGAAHGDAADEKKHGYAWGAIRWNADRGRWEAGWAPRILVAERGEMRPDSTLHDLDSDGFAWGAMDLRWP